MSLTIISGAAPGVEQGAIEAAINLALPWRGWCSADHIAALPAIYRTGLQPTSTTSPGMVRRINCQEAEGALVFSTSRLPVGVAAFVDRVTEQMGCAFLHATLNPAAMGATLPPEMIARVQDWIRGLPSGAVYVTGPSEDDEPGIRAAARDALAAILEPFAVDEVRSVARQLDLIGRSVEVPWPRHPPGPATRADLDELDAVPDPVDSDASARTFADVAPLAFDRRLEAIRASLEPPEGLDALQRAQLDASIREAERDIRDESQHQETREPQRAEQPV